MGPLRIGPFAQRVPDEDTGLLPFAGAQGLGRTIEALAGRTLALGQGRLRALAAGTGGDVGRVTEEDTAVDQRSFLGTASTEELRAAFQQALGLVRL